MYDSHGQWHPGGMPSTNKSASHRDVIHNIQKIASQKREKREQRQKKEQKIFLATEEQKNGESYKKAMMKFTRQFEKVGKPPPHCLLLQHWWLGKRYIPCDNRHPGPLLEQPLKTDW